MGRGLVALVGGGLVATALSPDRAQAYHVCGHTYTTGSCPHPFAPLSRTDRYGYPLHPTYGYAVDDAGDRYVERSQTRSKTCEQMVAEVYPFSGDPRYGEAGPGAAGGRLRHIQDCCSRSSIRINGDYAVRGYCPSPLEGLLHHVPGAQQDVLTEVLAPGNELATVLLAALMAASAIAGWSALYGP